MERTSSDETLLEAGRAKLRTILPSPAPIAPAVVVGPDAFGASLITIYFSSVDPSGHRWNGSVPWF